jgi:CRP-like cAMP-binding protein
VEVREACPSGESGLTIRKRSAAGAARADRLARFAIEYGRSSYLTLGGIAIMARGEKLHFDAKAFGDQHGGVTLSMHGENHALYAQGDAADSVFYIQTGKVRITVLSEQGKEAVVAVLEAGSFFGEECLAGQPLRVSAATTMTQCTIARLDGATFVGALHADLAFSELFVSHLLIRNIRLNEDLVDQLFNSSEMRLARALLLLANYGSDGREESRLPKIDQQTLANMIGTTRARVNYFMNKFRRLGFIDYNGHLRVHSSLLNAVLRDPSEIDT